MLSADSETLKNVPSIAKDDPLETPEQEVENYLACSKLLLDECEESHGEGDRVGESRAAEMCEVVAVLEVDRRQRGIVMDFGLWKRLGRSYKTGCACNLGRWLILSVRILGGEPRSEQLQAKAPK